MGFCVGDRVRTISKNFSGDPDVGFMGTVVTIDRYNQIGVEFDANFGGHDLNGFAKNGHGWWVCETDIELLNERPLQTPCVDDFLETFLNL